MINARTKTLFYRDEILPVQQRLLDQTQLHYNGMIVGIVGLSGSVESTSRDSEAGSTTNSEY